jgi:hypothetical protein
MAGLNNVQVFNRYAYSTVSELVAQQIALFNAATRGAIILRQASDNDGDFSEQTFWQLMSGAIRRRDPYSDGDVSAIDLQMLVDAMVKVAGGTPPINIPPVMFDWIGHNPEEGGVVIGQQLAPLMVQDMLNTAVSALAAALANQSSNFLDISGGTGGAELFSPAAIVDAKAKLGDRSGAIAAWVTHSKPMHNYWGGAVANATRLFTYGTVAVVSDPFGAPMIMADIPALVIAGSPTDYISLGLVPGAAIVERNDDFTQNIDTRNGGENIRRTYQAEWSYNLGLKGFTWDKTNGGKAPNAASIATGTNWDKTATSFKDLGGVALRTQ